MSGCGLEAFFFGGKLTYSLTNCTKTKHRVPTRQGRLGQLRPRELEHLPGRQHRDGRAPLVAARGRHGRSGGAGAAHH